MGHVQGCLARIGGACDCGFALVEKSESLSPSKPENPAAFPCVTPDGQDWNSGMRLRDYFAAQAMQALIVRGTYDGEKIGLAGRSFSIADAMLAERNK